ncbi:unnamed protein product, partial [Linum tenue]
FHLLHWQYKKIRIQKHTYIEINLCGPFIINKHKSLRKITIVLQTESLSSFQIK